AHAANAFAQLAQTTQGRAREEALYWQARALEQDGRTAAARSLYREIIDTTPNGYYAMWADKRLGVTPAARTAPQAPRAQAAAVQAPLADTFHSDRYNELRLAGGDGLARGEFAAIEATASNDPATLQFLLHAYQSGDG